MSKITVIHPSRERAAQCYKTAKMFLGNAETDVRYIVSVDLKDPALNTYLELFRMSDVMVDVNDNFSAITAVNNTAKKHPFDVVVVLSDDFVCDKGWDSKILEATDGFTEWVLKTEDGSNSWIVTLPIMDSYFYKRFGYIYNPQYKHLFCDTELTHVAHITGHLIVRNDILIKQVFINDDRKKITNDTWAWGERIYISRVLSNFDIPKVAIVKQITYQPHLDWLAKTMKKYG